MELKLHQSRIQACVFHVSIVPYGIETSQLDFAVYLTQKYQSYLMELKQNWRRKRQRASPSINRTLWN